MAADEAQLSDHLSQLPSIYEAKTNYRIQCVQATFAAQLATGELF